MGKMALLVVGSAAEVLSVSLGCPLPLQRTPPRSPLLFCCIFVFVGMGASRTAFVRLEVNLFLPDKRGGKSHFGMTLISALPARSLEIGHSQPFAATYIYADKAEPWGACLADGFEDHTAC